MSARDVAEMLDIGWLIFRWAAGADSEGWDTAAFAAEIRPEHHPNTQHSKDTHLRTKVELVVAAPEAQDAGGSTVAVETDDRSATPRPVSSVSVPPDSEKTPELIGSRER